MSIRCETAKERALAVLGCALVAAGSLAFAAMAFAGDMPPAAMAVFAVCPPAALAAIMKGGSL